MHCTLSRAGIAHAGLIYLESLQVGYHDLRDLAPVNPESTCNMQKRESDVLGVFPTQILHCLQYDSAAKMEVLQ